MPILQGGTFTATLSGADSTKIQPVSFTYYPIGPLILLILTAGFIVLVKQGRVMKGPYPLQAKYAALSPGLLAITAVLISSNSYVQAIATPLLGQSLTLLNWSRPNQATSHGFRAWIICSLVTAAAGVMNAGGKGTIVEIASGSLIMGAILAFPLAVIRKKIQNGITWSNIQAGALRGIATPVCLSLVFYLFSIGAGAPPVVLLGSFFLFLYLIVVLQPFCILLWKNPWAQAAAATPMIELPPEPVKSDADF